MFAVIWEMFSLCALGGVALVARHVDISNCLRILVLPDHFHTCFRIVVDNELYWFKALPFTWAYVTVILSRSPDAIDAQGQCLEHGCLKLFDDILVLGFGAAQVQPAPDAIVRVLVAKGAIVSPKSKRTPLNNIHWIRKNLWFGQGMIHVWLMKWATMMMQLMMTDPYQYHMPKPSNAMASMCTTKLKRCHMMLEIRFVFSLDVSRTPFSKIVGRLGCVLPQKNKHVMRTINENRQRAVL